MITFKPRDLVELDPEAAINQAISVAPPLEYGRPYEVRYFSAAGKWVSFDGNPCTSYAAERFKLAEADDDPLEVGDCTPQQLEEELRKHFDITPKAES